jgi:hypothetical protein
MYCTHLSLASLQVYSQDLPPLDFDAAALSAVQRAEGVDLTPEQQHQIILREKVSRMMQPYQLTQVKPLQLQHLQLKDG